MKKIIQRKYFFRGLIIIGITVILALTTNYAQEDGSLKVIDAVTAGTVVNGNIVIYNFTDTTNNTAYKNMNGGEWPIQPGGGGYSPYTTGQYSKINASDGSRNNWNGNLDKFANLLYRFKIKEPISNITQIKITWIGYDQLSWGNEFELDTWNFTGGGTWEKWYSTTSSRLSDQTYTQTYTSGFSHYINDSKYFYIGVSGAYTCFLPGTKILMADGNHKNIEEIEVGDIVISYNEGDKKFESNAVTHTFAHTEKEAGEYYLILNGKIRITPNHPLYTNDEWKEAEKLKIGDKLLTEKGDTIFVDSIEKVYEKVETYNLEVEGNHNYFADGILAHNKCPRIFSFNSANYEFDILINVGQVGEESERMFYYPLKHLEEPRIRMTYDPYEINYVNFLALKITDKKGSENKTHILKPVSLNATFNCDLSTLKVMDDYYLILDENHTEVFIAFEDFPELEEGYEREIGILSSGYQIILKSISIEDYPDYVQDFLEEYFSNLGSSHHTLYENYVEVEVTTIGPVHNLDTDEYFTRIQSAIDDADTDDGDTIKVDPGVYRENVVVYKELKIVGDPVIDGNGSHGINITANNTRVENMTITNCSLGIYVHNDSCTLQNVTLFNITIDDTIAPCERGIHFENVTRSEIIDSKMYNISSGSISYALYLLNSTYNNVTNSEIGDVENSMVAIGLYLNNSANNNITIVSQVGNITSTGGGYSSGVHLEYSDYNNITTIGFSNISCTGDGESYGIHLNSSGNNNITTDDFGNITAGYSAYGIYLDPSNNNIITTGRFGEITGNGYKARGIHLLDHCSNNNISTYGFGDINGNNAIGIFLLNECDYNNVSTHEFGDINGSNADGIYLIGDCDNNTILTQEFGDINGSHARGIIFNDGCDYNNISTYGFGDINGSSNDATGIYLLDYCSNNNISTHEFSDINSNSAARGIFILDNCNDNTISTHEFGDINSSSLADGIHLIGDCGYNNISTQWFGDINSSNDARGIYLLDNCSDNNISTNEFGDINGNTTKGVFLFDNCDHNNVSTYGFGDINGSTAEGINITDGCDNNTITTNEFGNINGSSSADGIHLHTDCDYNNISTYEFGDINSNGSSDARGIHLLDNCSNNAISTHEFGDINSNNSRGIHLLFNCSDNNISTYGFGDINGSDDARGIYLLNCSDNNISTYGFGDIKSSGYAAGIYLLTGCDYNNVSTHEFGNINGSHTRGIYLLDDCDYNNVSTHGFGDINGSSHVQRDTSSF